MQNNLLPKIFSNIVIHKKPHPFHETNNFNILALYVLKLRKMFDVILIKTLSWRDCVLKKKYLQAFIQVIVCMSCSVFLPIRELKPFTI